MLGHRRRHCLNRGDDVVQAPFKKMKSASPRSTYGSNALFSWFNVKRGKKYKIKQKDVSCYGIVE